MHEELRTFLVGLAHDVDKLTAYITDPGKALDEAGLSEEDKTILRSGDQNRLYDAIANPALAPAPQPEQPKAAQPAAYPAAYGQPPVPSPASATAGWGQYLQAAAQAYGWPAYAAGQWQPQIQYAVIPWPGQ